MVFGQNDDTWKIFWNNWPFGRPSLILFITWVSHFIQLIWSGDIFAAFCTLFLFKYMPLKYSCNFVRGLAGVIPFLNNRETLCFEPDITLHSILLMPSSVFDYLFVASQTIWKLSISDTQHKYQFIFSLTNHPNNKRAYNFSSLLPKK